METSQIKYLGLSANTSDYECHDGDLSAAVNLVNEEGHLKPLPQPKEVLSLLASRRILYIHTSATFRHYIIRETNTNSLLWADANASTISYTQFDNRLFSIFRVSSIGNTLVVLGDNGITSGIFYYVFKSDSLSPNYKYIGQKPPMVQIQFGLGDNKKANWDRSGVGVLQTPSEYSYAWLGTGYEGSAVIYSASMTDTKAYFHDDMAERITDKVWSLINKANSLVSSQGHFYAPFFVRYCYRLYDGSTIMHSAPVFMPLSSPKSYCVELPQLTYYLHNLAIRYIGDSNLYNIDNDGNQQTDEQIQTTSFTFRMRPCNVSLDYKVLKDTTYNTYVVPELISDWGDIVKSIDIFVSQPIIREKTNEAIKSATVAGDFIRLNKGFYHIRRFDQVEISGALSPDYINVVCDIPLLTESEYLKRIQDTSTFYKVASFKPNELIYGDADSLYQHPISIPSETLPNLAVQEAMTDDYHSHNNILPYLDSGNNCLTSLFIYNSRLNISCVKEQLFEGFPAEVMVPRAETYDYTDITLNVLGIYVYLKTEEGEKIVYCHRFNNGSHYKPGSVSLYSCPLFYPDNRAYQMDLLVDENGIYKFYRFAMTQHAFLNGSITSGHIITNGTVSFEKHSVSTFDINDILSHPNYIYSSEVNNPFLFRPENIHTVGTGLILGIAAATKALSQGQFGQYPLYAFASDGVWALSVNTDGSFNTIQPVSRDVCTNPDSITSIDNAVLFATSRGIMLIQGSDTVCLTDSLLSNSPFALSSLPQLTALLTAQFGWLSDHLTSLFPQFSAFLNGVRIVYDYTNQRIILYNPTEVDDTRPDSESSSSNTSHPLYYFAFVYSLKSQLWSSMKINIAYSLNSYPDALVVSRDNKLLSFDDSVIPSSGFYQLLISRPLKLGMSDTFKTINSLIQRGIFSRGNVRTLLYASRDLQTWYLIASSVTHEIHNLHGSPWKYYRIVTLAHNLTADNSLSGATLLLTPKYTNRLH